MCSVGDKRRQLIFLVGIDYLGSHVRCERYLGLKTIRVSIYPLLDSGIEIRGWTLRPLESPCLKLMPNSFSLSL